MLLLFIVLNCCPSNYLPGGLDLCVMADDINVVFICYCYCYSCFCCLLSLFIIVLKCCPSNPLPGGPDGLQLSWVSSDFHIQDALQSKLENNYKGKDRLEKGTCIEYAIFSREKKKCFKEYMQFYLGGLVKKLQPNNKFQPINEDFNQLPMLSMEGGELHRTMPICRCLKK